MKRARVIYNPTSGKELIRKHLADILEVLEKAGYEASAFCDDCSPILCFRDEASRAGKPGFDLLLLQPEATEPLIEVVNGIAPLKSAPKWRSSQAEQPMIMLVH